MGGQLYDGIGEAFEGFKTLPLARYGEVPGVLGLVGDVRGRSVLDPPISFEANPPSREVYEGALRAAGFSGVEWVPLEVSAEGVRVFGAEFWADLVANPPLVMLRCRA